MRGQPRVIVGAPTGILVGLRGRERFSTALNFKTGKTTEMVCVKLAVPSSSPYGKRIAKNYDARSKKAKASRG
mgnify:CR=1 FL=1